DSFVHFSLTRGERVFDQGLQTENVPDTAAELNRRVGSTVERTAAFWASKPAKGVGFLRFRQRVLHFESLLSGRQLREHRAHVGSSELVIEGSRTQRGGRHGGKTRFVQILNDGDAAVAADFPETGGAVIQEAGKYDTHDTFAVGGGDGAESYINAGPMEA